MNVTPVCAQDAPAARKPVMNVSKPAIVWFEIALRSAAAPIFY
jgi:hypothetical protein